MEEAKKEYKKEVVVQDHIKTLRLIDGIVILSESGEEF